MVAIPLQNAHPPPEDGDALSLRPVYTRSVEFSCLSVEDRKRFLEALTLPVEFHFQFCAAAALRFRNAEATFVRVLWIAGSPTSTFAHEAVGLGAGIIPPTKSVALLELVGEPCHY